MSSKSLNERKKNVGILTLFYKSHNYGGLLQAYALTKVINNLDFNTMQIKYNYKLRTKKTYRELLKYYSLGEIFAKISSGILRKKNNQAKTSGAFKERVDKANIFANSIPNTGEVYTEENMNDLLQKFDIFVVGSDQIWNEFSSAFFLDFVPQNYGKISYAPSMSNTSMSSKKLKYMANYIEKFDFVSVREISAKDSLQPFVQQKIHVTLDPTYLLDKDEWQNLAKDYDINQKYIFVYLLGENSEHRKRIKEISKMLNLAIVFIPHVHLTLREVDNNFADIELYDVGPEEFVGLIKNAEMIITDSFHGCVISSILEKNFWAVKRHTDTNAKNMNSRLYTLFENMQINNRFLENFNNDEVLSNEIDYKVVNKNIKKLRKNSIDHLQAALYKHS